MIKKMMVGLLIAMVGVCFADYKSEFNFNINDATKIDNFLAEATAAKNEIFIGIYSKLKLVVGKDSKNMSYNEFKKLLNNDKHKVFVPQFAVQIKRFNAFIPNVLNDSEFNNNSYVKSYVKNFYPASKTVIQTIGYKVWREKFLNVTTLKIINDVKRAKKVLNNYELNSGSLSASEIKTDYTIFKRAWYSNITKSEEWKKLLVEIELMIKSVE